MRYFLLTLFLNSVYMEGWSSLTTSTNKETDMSNGKNIRVETDAQGDKVATLCGGKDCCPTVTIKKDGTRVINDDFGGQVTLTEAQFVLLKEV